MSLPVRVATLSANMSKEVHKKCTVTPTPSEFQKSLTSSDPKPILCYSVNRSGNTSILRLPFFLARVMKKNGAADCGQGSTREAHFTFTGTLKSEQQDAFQEAQTQLQKHNTTLLNLPTGFGKTVLSASLAAKCKMRTIVVFNIRQIQNQWKDSFETFTDARVEINTSSKGNKKQKALAQADVVISSVGTLHHLPDLDFGVVICDEMHRLCTQAAVRGLLSLCPSFVIACTATMERADDLHAISELFCGLHRVRRELKKIFTVYRFATRVKIEPKTDTSGRIDFTEVKNDIYNSEKRNRDIQEFVEKNPDRKILILTWGLEHAKALVSRLCSLGVSCDGIYGNKKSYVDSRVLVGTIGKISTGFDEGKPSRRLDTLLLTGSTRRQPLLEQCVGRVLRGNDCVVVDFVDDCKLLESHWRERRKWYKAKNCDLINIDKPQKV